MRQISRYALASLFSLGLAAVVYLIGCFEAKRMEDNGQGFEMFFYFSPAMTLVIDGLVIVGAVGGLIGIVRERTVSCRLQALAACLVCLVCLAVVPWRGSLFRQLVADVAPHVESVAAS